MKKYLHTSLVYAICAMVSGVFYREFTKLMSFAGKTTLSVLHTHFFILGMFFFLIALLLEKNFAFNRQKQAKPFYLIYNIGLCLTALMLMLRGVFQVLQRPLTNGANAAISGLAGLGHILLGTGIILLFITLKKQLASKA